MGSSAQQKSAENELAFARKEESDYTREVRLGMEALDAFLCTRFWLISGRRIVRGMRWSMVYQEKYGA